MKNYKKQGFYFILAIGIIGGALVLTSYRPVPAMQEQTPPTQADLKTLLANNTHVVVDFFADWCPACKASKPLFNEMAQASELQGKVSFVSVNIDEHADLALAYNIEYLPTFVFFKEGKVLEHATGYLSKEQLTTKINALFALH